MYLHLYSFILYLQWYRILEISHLSIIPECYSVYLVIFPICAFPLRGTFEHPQGANTQCAHAIEVYQSKSFVLTLNVQFLSTGNLYMYQKCASTAVSTFVYMYELKLVL